MSVITEVMPGVRPPVIVLHQQLLEAPFDSATVYQSVGYNAVRLKLAGKVFDVHLFESPLDDYSWMSDKAKRAGYEHMVDTAVELMRRHKG